MIAPLPCPNCGYPIPWSHIAKVQRSIPSERRAEQSRINGRKKPRRKDPPVRMEPLAKTEPLEPPVEPHP